MVHQPSQSQNEWSSRPLPQLSAQNTRSADEHDGDVPLTEADRRQFIKMLGGSLALAGLTGCTRQPSEQIVPYVREQEGIVPGRPLQFATTLTRSGYGLGTLVESHMGRPVKVEGNPDHPASLGRTDIFAQSSVYTLYDPHRSQAVRERGDVRTWDRFIQDARAQIAGDGSSLRLLTGHITSPTTLAQIQRLLDSRPDVRWHSYDPVHRAFDAGIALASGEKLRPIYQFERAKTVVSFDCDFLFDLPGSVRYARDFANRRRAWVTPDRSAEQLEMNRLYAAEPDPTLTGAKADHHLPATPREIELLIAAMAAEVGVLESAVADLPEKHRRWVSAATQDLMQHRGESVVLAGRSLPAAMQGLVHLINERLANLGTTVTFIPDQQTVQSESLESLVRDMAAGEVTGVFIAGCNPVYDTPADLAFGEHLERVPWSAHLSLFEDETSARCRWHLPMAHELESWGDARAYDGSASLIQPLIMPLYQGRTLAELLAGFLDSVPLTTHQLVQQYWRSWVEARDFSRWWREVLKLGWIPDSQPEPRVPALDAAAIRDAYEGRRAATVRAASDLTLVLRPDPSIWDGSYASNPWLQELPKPITKLTWGNAAHVAPLLAERLGVQTGDLLALSIGTLRVEVPAIRVPGMADGCISLTLGYGRWAGAGEATRLGANAYALRTTHGRWIQQGLRLWWVGQSHRLAVAQHHQEQEDRELLRTAGLDELKHHPDAVIPDHKAHVPREYSLYPEEPWEGQQWGMAIDLTTCIGCNACTIACQAENNIPSVGREGVLRNREMHWIRVDRYFEGPPDSPEIHHQPVPCMHCENAPCELVCPVEATLHSFDGLNEMIYNRCIGTRYCSNNCPYKVRRFNFFDYIDDDVEVLKLLRNPDVTVRGLGVMEKCTYCVQRIRQAGIEARKEERLIRDGEVVTACQSVCPTDAIVFGDINDPTSVVSLARKQPQEYAMLHELNTRPRTTYLAAISNPNPALK